MIRNQYNRIPHPVLDIKCDTKFVFAKDASTKGMFYKDHITITSTKSYLQVTKTYFDLSTVNSNIYRDRI